MSMVQKDFNMKRGNPRREGITAEIIHGNDLRHENDRWVRRRLIIGVIFCFRKKIGKNRGEIGKQECAHHFTRLYNTVPCTGHLNPTSQVDKKTSETFGDGHCISGFENERLPKASGSPGGPRGVYPAGGGRALTGRGGEEGGGQ